MTDYKELYGYLYRKLNFRTPLKCDCGALCGSACCDGGDENLGMYLFPGEELMFENNPRFSVEDSEFEYGDKKCKIIYCESFCERKERPLACRIFPLFPYVTRDGFLKVITDPRGRGVCPLAVSSPNSFSAGFKRGVLHIGRELMKYPETSLYLFELSRLIDEETEQLLSILG